MTQSKDYVRGYRDGYETAREDAKHSVPAFVALNAFIKAYGSQDSHTEGLDRAAQLARDAIAIEASPLSRQTQTSEAK